MRNKAIDFLFIRILLSMHKKKRDGSRPYSRLPVDQIHSILIRNFIP
jgi:hypothetical protein